MLQHQDDDEVDEFDDEHASEVSSDEDTYYQTVAVGGRRGRLDCTGGGATSGAQRGAAARKSVKNFVDVEIDVKHAAKNL